MIAFAVQAGRPQDMEAYKAFCRKGLARALCKGDRLLILHDKRSIHHAYNDALDWAKRLPGLEALFLVHADAEIMTAYQLRMDLAGIFSGIDDAAVVGVCGARSGVQANGLSWWQGPCAGGVLHGMGATEGYFHTKGLYEAQIVDGVLIGLSPWAVHHLRFDPDTYAAAPWYAYDCDISLQALAAGKRVFVGDTVVWHHTYGGIKDAKAWEAANEAFNRKWASWMAGGACSS